VFVRVFDGQARACGQYSSKGRHFAVSGRLELDEWSADDGSKRSLLYVLAQSVEFLGTKPKRTAARRGLPEKGG
jgi:single-strand DNA-binding protein